MQGVSLPETLRASEDMAEVVKGAEIILMVCSATVQHWISRQCRMCSRLSTVWLSTLDTLMHTQVIPTPFVARTVAPLADLLQPHQILVSCTKGILNDTLETPNQVQHEVYMHTPSSNSMLLWVGNPSAIVGATSMCPCLMC